MQNNQSKRSRIEIIAQILENAENGIVKTRVIKRCNLNNSVIDKYLFFLINKALLKKEKKKFYLTDKGAQFLKTYRKIDLIMTPTNSRGYFNLLFEAKKDEK